MFLVNAQTVEHGGSGFNIAYVEGAQPAGYVYWQPFRTIGEDRMSSLVSYVGPADRSENVRAYALATSSTINGRSAVAPIPA